MILQTVIVIIPMKVQNQTGETNIYMYLMKYHPGTMKTQVFSLSVLNFYSPFIVRETTQAFTFRPGHSGLCPLSTHWSLRQLTFALFGLL